MNTTNQTEPKMDRCKSLEALIDWAYRASYAYAIQAADEYAQATGLTRKVRDLGMYNDGIEFVESGNNK